MSTYNEIGVGSVELGGEAENSCVPKPRVSIEAGLYQFLNSHESITDIVGDRIWRHRLPQDYDWSIGPAISFWKVSETHDHDLDGGSGVARARIQIDTWSNDPDDPEDVAEEIRLLLQGFSGTMAPNVEVMETLLENVRVDAESPKQNGTDEWRFHWAVDYMITYRTSKTQNAQ